MIGVNFYKGSLFTIFSLLIINSCKNDSLLFKEDFRANTHHWDTLSSEAIQTKIENGHLLMHGKLKNVINYSLLFIPVSNRNIIYSTSIQVNDFYAPDGLAGIILHADDHKYPENYLLFGINAENEVLISYESKKKDMSKIYYKQKTQKYKKKEKNSFSIVTDKSSIQFLLNDKVLTTISKNKELGSCFGYLVINSNISVSYLQIKNR
ncbi:hypothetical protein Ga0061079_11123 [Apibacter mensalis]|uniref:3-keto-disaccharide hydrolase domain-containing protein n=1 Tax=Apibacter mensalis TaxID=1586267 RepID=A0A0X3AQZ2_9FLAO|nr:hypothetical protein [Apibacter mensalis]CVK16831.1 hypothetical protein Ga0061079_11123 [Apibacter mensalis]